jgi:hypothetical protein
VVGVDVIEADRANVHQHFARARSGQVDILPLDDFGAAVGGDEGLTRFHEWCLDLSRARWFTILHLAQFSYVLKHLFGDITPFHLSLFTYDKAANTPVNMAAGTAAVNNRAWRSCMRMKAGVSGLMVAMMLAMAPASHAQDAKLDPMTPDIVAKYDWVRPEADFVRQEVMIPMRDGVKLHTFIVYRKGTTDAPIILSRSPYNADGHTSRNRSQKIEEILPVADKNSSMTAISASIRTCAG